MKLQNFDEGVTLFSQNIQPNEQNFTVANLQNNIIYFFTEDHGTFTKMNVILENQYPSSYTNQTTYSCI